MPVSAERLVEDVWGGRAGPDAVHPFVSRLRKVLGRDAIPQRRGGYVVDRDLVAVDADAFVAEVDDGRRALARGADAEAAVLLEAALARWQGERAYCGIADVADIPVVDAEADRLDELRVAAAEALADAHVRLDRGGEDVDRLGELVARYPLRESLAARQVMALYAAGRQADALAAYERCRRALADQLGVDPAPPLRRVHAAVLAQQALGAVSAAGPALRSNLPQRARAFVERPELAARRRGRAGRRRPPAGGAVRHARGGQDRAGVRARAPAAAGGPRRVVGRRRGPRGHRRGAGRSRRRPWASRTRAREEDTRAALWAELDRAPGWVLVFDNADEPARLEPYLPTAVHGDVIITSRDQAWRRLARPIPVPSLTRAESVTYVVERSGDPDTAAAAELAELLGDLPLALQQACAYVEQTGMTVPDYVRLYRGRQAELGAVATTWGLAFDRLRRRSPLAAGVLETMSFLAADTIAVEMLWPLADGDELDVQEAIGELLRLSLVDRKGPILRVHRLVQDVVRVGLGPATAGTRLDAAARICLAVEADERDAAAHLVQVAAHCEALRRLPLGLLDGLAAVARRFAERALYPAAEQVLTAALRLADVQSGGAGTTIQRGTLLCQLGEVLDAAGRLDEALDLHRHAVELLDGEPEADELVLAHAYNRLGHVLNCADDTASAVAAHERSLKTLRAVQPRRPRRPGAGRPRLHALGRRPARPGGGGPHHGPRADGARQPGLGARHGWARHGGPGPGLVEEAVELHRRAIDAFTAVSGADHPDTAQAMDKLGYALRLLHRPAEAIEQHRRAVALLVRVLGEEDPRVAMTLSNLGLALGDAGLADQAIDTQTRAHQLFQAKLGPTHASTLMAGRRRAVALAAAGRTAQAVPLIQEVLAALVDRVGEAELGAIAGDVALVYAAAGDTAAAREWRSRAT